LRLEIPAPYFSRSGELQKVCHLAFCGRLAWWERNRYWIGTPMCLNCTL